MKAITQPLDSFANILGFGAKKLPPPKPPAEMPDPANIADAKRRTLEAAQAGTGRQSTILTGTEDRLGG